MKPRILVFDTLDDRREIVTLLDKLPPAKRIAWLSWCCRQSAKPQKGMFPRVQQKTKELADKARWDTVASDRLTVECYSDLWHLVGQYDLDVDRAVNRLERMVRRPSDAC